ncbi:MAG: hypothetical protein Q4G68_12100 [Planctomycetia bacterium]|nr:hypothetical protein [Planctomycetia bacterium]
MAEPAPQSIQAERSQEQTTGNGYLWLTRGIAVLLLFAAGMKAWQLATVPLLGEGLLHARWFNIAVVEFEIAFACWLLMGLLPKLTRWATIALFTTFAGVSLYKAVSGEASCGCFGAVTVNPWWTMGLDVVVVGIFVLSNLRLMNVALASLHPCETKILSNWFVQTGFISFILFVIMTTQIIIFFGSFVGFGNFLSDNKVVFLLMNGKYPPKRVQCLLELQIEQINPSLL